MREAVAAGDGWDMQAVYVSSIFEKKKKTLRLVGCLAVVHTTHNGVSVGRGGAELALLLGKKKDERVTLWCDVNATTSNS